MITKFVKFNLITESPDCVEVDDDKDNNFLYSDSCLLLFNFICLVQLILKLVEFQRYGMVLVKALSTQDHVRLPMDYCQP